jgi:hypothetical protein
MEIHCECGKFRAELTKFPQATPGRLVCYCEDCQSFLHSLNRADLLDENGGSEIIPAYPADIRLTAGKEHLACTRLSPKGMYRFSTSCCKTPVANTDMTRPWVGFYRRMYTVKDPNLLEKELGPVKSRIMGKFAKGTPPEGTPKTFDFRAMISVLPFILKGVLFKKAKPSPFFESGESLVKPQVLTLEERRAALDAARAKT